MENIPNSVANNEFQGDIPNIVAELPENSEEPENKPYVISFSKYKQKLCEIELLDKNKGKKALGVLKEIGTKIKSQTDFQRHNIDRIPVTCSGDYRKLFNGLSEDIELKELKLQEDARIFYFDIEPERTLYIVAITKNHFETDKVRR